jgi:precorrin-3B synthase
MSASMNPSRRRGACPGLSAPMQTGDGLLARLASAGATIRLEAAAALCAAARRHGNGILEITARGSIQIRGLTAASAPAFADTVAALGIDAGDGVPILTDPLAGLEPLDAELGCGRAAGDSLPPCGGGLGWGVVPKGTAVPHLTTPTPNPSPQAGGEEFAAPSRLNLAPTQREPEQQTESLRLAGALRQRLAGASFTATLGPKVAVVIDGGSALHLDAIRADVRLRASPGFAGWHVGLGGDAASATPIGWVAPANAVEAMVRLLGTIAQHGPQARARDLIHGQGPGAFRCAIADLLIDAPSPAPRPASNPIGTHTLRDGRVGIGIGLAFGHTDADALEGLIEAAKRAGASGLRTAPGRALLLVGLAEAISTGLLAEAESLGFITRRDDPRRNVVACAGAPICASAEIPARALGPVISSAAARLLDGSLTVHVSGCPKGCAHPGASALTIVGRQGVCGLIVDGSAHDHPGVTIAAADLPAAFGRMAQDVARVGRPGETAADTLARLGAARLATIFGANRHG